MKMEMQDSYQADSNGHSRTGFTFSIAAVAASNIRYTCSMHPEIVRDAPGSCPKCGMTLIPV